MFKSIEYKLILYIVLLIGATIGSTYYFIAEEFPLAFLFALGILLSLNKLYRHYSKFNKNILFLLNALDNGDYSFNFSETKLSKREKELNQMMNRIKDILSNARREAIESEKFISLIVESISTGIIILNDRNHVQTINHTATDLLNLHILTHINQLSNLDESLPAKITNMKPGENIRLRVANEREERQITIHLTEITIRQRLYRIITLNDIDNELDANEMESWIKLIRVMTHEIMNSIAPITSLSEALLEAHQSQHVIQSNEKDKENLNRNTIEAFETINSTARGLLSFVESYRKFTGVPKPQCMRLDLIPLLEKIICLESTELDKKEINVEIISERPNLQIYADENQFIQVLVNLIKNAIEAIEPGQNGKIKLEIKRKENYIHIDVCNNGSPISQEIVPHIFIPFFTTKETGSGIGLSVSRYIMRLHGGNLKHHTTSDWTVFSLTFPEK